MTRRGTYGTQTLPVLPVPISAIPPSPIIQSQLSVINTLNILTMQAQNRSQAREETRIVVKTDVGGQIQKTIDSIVDASADKPYTVEIPAGIYEEELTLKPYINFKGQGHQNTKIKMTSVTNGLINIGTNCNNSEIQFDNITFHLTDDLKSIVYCLATGVKVYFNNSFILNDGAAGIYFWNGVASASNKIFLTNSICRATSSAYGILINKDNANTSDTFYVKNCILDQTTLYVHRGTNIIHYTGCTSYYTNGGGAYAGRIVLDGSPTLYMTGVKEGLPDTAGFLLDLLSGTVKIVGVDL